MDETRGPVTLDRVIFPGEADNIRWALTKACPLGWSPADEALALRLYALNPGWPCEKAVAEAIRMTSQFIDDAKAEAKQ